MGNINPGYMGIASIAGVGNVRFNDANIAAKQAINAPDMVTGDYNHDAYVYDKIEVGGSISGPVTENFAGGAGGVWGWATTRDACGLLSVESITISYYCGAGGARTFSNMLANSVTFSCAAGDIAQFSLDVMGTGAAAGGAGSLYGDVEKLITWDKCGVSLSVPYGTVPVAYSNFELTVSNNLTPVYSLGQANLFPYEIVPGMRTITGSVSAYNLDGSIGADTWDDYSAIGAITFNIGNFTATTNVQFHRVEPTAGVGPIVSTMAFTGIGPQAW